jgi:BirA family biotin operon repressor/biotin-[acetyl-CoA-carboxylase] ligase
LSKGVLAFIESVGKADFEMESFGAQPIEVSESAGRLAKLLRGGGTVARSDAAARLGLGAAACDRAAAELRRLGYTVDSIGDSSYLLRGVPDRLLPNEIGDCLETRWLGRSLHCFESVGSTNSVAREMAAAGAPDGTAVVAEGQSQGRGRLGRSWVSPPRRNLYLSVVLRMALPLDRLPQISLLAGVAACDAVREWHAAAIKWPNDVLVGGRKVAGILAETEGGGGVRSVVLGVGVNLNSLLDDFPEDLRDKAGSLRLATGAPVDRARFASRLLGHLERRVDQLGASGFAPIAAAWSERCDLIGHTIRVREPGHAVSGEVLGLDAGGALRLRLSGGGEHRVVAGDVTVVGGYGETDRS